MSKKQPTSQESSAVGQGLAALLNVTASSDIEETPSLASSGEDSFSTQIVTNDAKTAEINRVSDALAQFREPEVTPELIIAAKESAERTLAAAQKLAKEAALNLRKCQDEFDALNARAKALDTMTDAQRNLEYLESQKKARFAQAEEQQKRFAALSNAGLLTQEEMRQLAPPVTALDRAIGERNQKLRQQQNAAGLMRR